MLASVLVPISMAVANLANLLTQVVVPRYLSPSSYSYFALLWASGQFLAVLLTEWLRFGVLRFAEGADEALARRRRNVLVVLYLSIFFGINLLAGAFFAFRALSSEFVGWAVICFYASCQSIFEGRQAFSRANSDNSGYSLGMFLRSVCALSLAWAISAFTGDPFAVMLGLGVGYLLSYLVLDLRSRVFLFNFRAFEKEQFSFLLKYGGFAAFSTVLTSFFPAMVRFLTIHFLGLQKSGGVILAFDLSQKAVAVVGLAVNLVVLQKSTRVSEFGAASEKLRQTSLQIGVTSAFVCPAAVGFYSLHPLLGEFLVPKEYLDSYISNIGIASFCSAVLAFRMFALDALFFVSGKSILSVAGPICSILLGAVAIFVFGAAFGYEGWTVAAGICFGLVGGVLCSIAFARSAVKIVWPFREFAVIGLGCLGMYLVLSYCTYGVGGVNLIARLVVGSVFYCVWVFALDLFGVRSIFMGRIKNKSV